MGREGRVGGWEVFLWLKKKKKKTKSVAALVRSKELNVRIVATMQVDTPTKVVKHLFKKFNFLR